MVIDLQQLGPERELGPILLLVPMDLAAQTDLPVRVPQESGATAGTSTSPNSKCWNFGPAFTRAGAHSRSRSRFGSSTCTSAICANGINVYCPAANTSRRAPIRGSASARVLNGSPFSVPETAAAGAGSR